MFCVHPRTVSCVLVCKLFLNKDPHRGSCLHFYLNCHTLFGLCPTVQWFPLLVISRTPNAYWLARSWFSPQRRLCRACVITDPCDETSISLPSPSIYRGLILLACRPDVPRVTRPSIKRRRCTSSKNGEAKAHGGESARFMTSKQQQRRRCIDR